MKRRVELVRPDQRSWHPKRASSVLWHGKVEEFFSKIPSKPIFDLVVTSPPYNLGKEYEEQVELAKYISWQQTIIQEIIPRLKPTGSVCWQLGNYVKNGRIIPLDYLFAPIFDKLGLIMRNRIVWRFGHGLHCQRRFSGRYEVVLWYTRNEEYKFNLDAVRLPAKYPGKRHFKGPKKGQYSGNPLGKNPEDVWDIPNVKSNHIEKTLHPCQFPVGLVERLVLSLSDKGDLVFDPFAGVCSSGVAAVIHGRTFWGCEPEYRYVRQGKNRIDAAYDGKALYRPHDRPPYDHTKSKLSINPHLSPKQG